MDELLRDVRFAIRGLIRTPGFAAAAVLALALGIGATTAIFSVVHAVLLRSLGWGEETRLVSVRGNFFSQNLIDIWISVPEYKDLQASPMFEKIGVYYDYTAALQGDRAERVRTGFATGSFFESVGIAPVYGRTFTPEEDNRGTGDVAMLSWAAWQKRFGGDPAAVGKSVTLDGQPRTIVGILPRDFRWSASNEFWIPFGWKADDLQDRGSRGLNAVARLRRGLTLEAARRNLDEVSAQIRAANPKNYPPEAKWTLSMQPLRDRFLGSARQPLLILFGAVFFVLLIACANVANLLLARGAARSREIAVRTALGGSRTRLIRQLLTESAVLSVAGAALGLAISVWALDVLLAAAPASVQQFADVRVSRAVLAFAASMVILTTFVFGLVPALQTTRLDVSQSLKDGGRGSAGPRAGRLRSTLVVGQIALSLVLLIGAGLFLRSFASVLQVNPGFDASRVLAAPIALGGDRYESRPAETAYWTEAVRRASELPGVVAAGAINLPPLEGRTDSSYEIEGYQLPPGDPGTDDEIRFATSGYFKAMAIPVIEGRDLADTDDAKAPLVALVNQAWVRRYFPGQSALGKRIRVDPKSPWFSVVGVVGDTHDFGFDQPTPPIYFLSMAQVPRERATVMVRSTGALAPLVKPLRDALAAVDATQPVDRIEPFEAHIAGALSARRFPLQLLGAFAALAVLLSALGIYGVTAYGVTQRTKEIGVRIAVGAQRADVLRMVMSGAARLAAIGVVIGLAGALIGARLLSSQLYGVSARDPLTYAAISALLAVVALLASLLPALRATRVDPMSALRAE